MQGWKLSARRRACSAVAQLFAWLGYSSVCRLSPWVLRIPVVTAACKPDFDVTVVPDHKHLAFILLGRGVLSQGSSEWGDGAESPLVAVLRKIFILILSTAK